jgi:hypothetical protein
MDLVWELACAAQRYGRGYEWLQLVLGSVECGVDSVVAAKAAAKELGL